MKKYTPGPWLVGIADPTMSDMVAETARHEIYGQLSARRLANNSDAYLEDGANARLIAAAPEMFEALVGLVELIERGDLVRDATNDGDPDWALKMLDFVPRITRAQLAIAKARGEP